jgi:Bardet-Biedl syndrome 1 protein
MHRIFQRDLCKLRLTTARAYVKTITDGTTALTSVSGATLRLNASVAGLGPLFKLRLDVQNAGSAPAYDVTLALTYNHELYRVPEPVVTLPLLLPSVHYTLELPVHSIDAGGAADAVRIFVTRGRALVPAIGAIVNMPMAQILPAG